MCPGGNTKDWQNWKKKKNNEKKRKRFEDFKILEGLRTTGRTGKGKKLMKKRKTN